MKKLHYFNPENDICLALGDKSYSMSPQVKCLHESGELLPLWWGEPDDMVYAPHASDEYVERLRDKFPSLPSVVKGRISQGKVVGSPWGWSHDSAKLLSGLGCEVPDRQKIERLRMLSHRRISIEIMDRLKSRLDFEIARVPVEIRNIEELDKCYEEFGNVFIKSPWSSSGRGVFFSDRYSPKVAERCEGVIRKQGSLLVEKALVKKCDFAMLFRSESGRISHVGYSAFFNSGITSYGGNLLSEESGLVETIVQAGASEAQLYQIQKTLEMILSELIGDSYEGYFGVDMLIDDNGIIAPCIELNLRMTMGVVAMMFYNKYMPEGAKGRFCVMPRSVRSVNQPLPIIENGKLVYGGMELGMPDGAFTFFAEVL